MPISCGFSTMPSILIVHGRSLSACAALAIVLLRAELVEIVVAGVDLLVGHRPVEREFLVALGRIEIRGRVRQVGDALRGGDLRATATAPPHRRAGQEGAAVEEQVLRAWRAVPEFPSRGGE